MDEKKDEIMEKNTAEADIGDEKKDGITENTAEAVDGEEKKDINPEESTAQSAGENKEETEGAEKPSDAAEPTEQEIGESVKKEPSAPKDATMESFDIVSLHPGQVVDGTVLTVTPDELIVNVGYKSDGIVTKDEIAFQDGKTVEESFHEGDKIKVEVLKVNDGEGNVVLSQKKIIKHKIWKEIEDAYQNKKEVTGVGKEVIKGGVLADIRGISAFVPASQLSVRYVADLSTFVGQDLRLRILETDKRRSRVVASQRVILEEEAAEQRNKVWDNIQEGQKITGEVKRLTNFGAFVDIGGVDGLIHISDLARKLPAR